MTAGLWSAALATFLLGIAYFVAAVPTGVALGLPVLVSGLAAWAGYSAIALFVVALGGPAREALARRFGWRLELDPKRLFWRVWGRWGLPGLALLAPVTIGPYFAAFLALALGERPPRVVAWISFGAVPATLGFAAASWWGASLIRG